MLLLWTKEIQELSDVTGFLPIITTFTTALSMSHSLQGLSFQAYDTGGGTTF